MATTNLNDDNITFSDGKDSVVIVDNFASVRGGRSLNVVGFAPKYIRAGHVIIKETATGDYKPMPATGDASIATLGTIVAGSGYTNGSYLSVPLTGGSGSGATANITVASGAVTVVTIVNAGSGYAVADSLGATALPGGTGFSVPVATIAANGVYGSLPAGHTYQGILISSILTSKPMAGIMTQGTINPTAAPKDFATIAAAFKTAVPLIDQRAD